MSEPRKDKHSATGVVGSPKKGGAGGKFTWGAPGVSDLTTTSLDKSDPNYDSEDDMAPDVVTSVLELDPKSEFKKSCENILSEFFESEDIGEVVTSLNELNEPNWMDEFVKRALMLSLEKNDRERELISYLLSSLYSIVIPKQMIEEGFWGVLARADDLILDTPSAITVLGNFLARAVVDEIIPPSLLNHMHYNVQSTVALDAVVKAQRLLEGKNVAQRLENIWEGAGTSSSYRMLKDSLKGLVDEFLMNADLSEAERCLRELKLPTFHFQLVKTIITASIEKDNAPMDSLFGLLQKLIESHVVTEAQCVTGFLCCINSVADLIKDIHPNSKTLLLACVNKAVSMKFIPETFAAKAEVEINNRLEIEARQSEKANGAHAQRQ